MVPGDTSTGAVAQEMVCAPDSGNHALCIVRDKTSTCWQGNKITLNMPATTTAEELINEVAKKCNYEPDSFDLLLQQPPGVSNEEVIVLNAMKPNTLEAIGFRFEDSARNNLIISEKNRTPPKKVEGAGDDVTLDDLSLGASASPTAHTDSSVLCYTLPRVPSGEYSFSTSLIKHDTGFVGLVNQAMTCYLNSLLQALYMTPEFRNALYRWEFAGNEEEEVKSIPYQLQKLFLQLQTSSKHAVETTELTRSFGWDSSEAWQQHDIQELCRVMFDALEQKFKNTEQADLISRLYEGKMTDYVKCLECSTEKARGDTFLDIPLPVRPFGSTQAYGSVEEALRAFVQPEVLDGNNQYFCDNCNKKCDAHKGLKFSRFPYLLTLHLKRFDFNYQTLHRIKLNDKVTFPEILNLNSFIQMEKDDSETHIDETANKYDDASTTDSGSALDDESCHGPDIGVILTNGNEYQDDDEGIDLSNGPNHHENEKNRQHSMEEGPYIYELFSIMIHSGSASGGHYYAYIKDFKHGQWYCFNDQSVSMITYDDIRKTYGGGPSRGYYSSAYSSSTNAYMLMYRQIDKERNAEFMMVEDFPEHIKVLLKKMQEREEQERADRERERNMCKIKLFCRHPVHNVMIELKLRVHKDTTLKEATRIAYEEVELESVVPLDHCRLVKYDEFHDNLECSFENMEDEPISEVLGGVKTNYKFDLLLEIREEDKQFEVYRPGGTAVKVHVVDLNTEEVEGPFVVRGYLSQTVWEFKELLGRTLNLNPDNMRIVLERYCSDLRLLSSDEKSLRGEGFYRSNKIFVESSDTDDKEKTCISSKFYSIIDRYENTITLIVSLPSTEKEVLEQLSVPALDSEDSGSKDSEDMAFEQAAISSSSSTSSHCDVCLTNQTEVRLTSANVSVDVRSINYLSESHSHDSPKHNSDPEDEGIGDSECIQDNNHGGAVHSDQSASEDSSLTDSDRTLVGDPQDDLLAKISSPSDSPHGSEDHNVSSPEDSAAKEYIKSFSKEVVCDREESPPRPEPSKRKHFRATEYIDPETEQKMLKVLVDKRILLGPLKKELEPYVGVPTDHFKIYRLYNNDQELECTRLTENFSSYGEEVKIIVKLGRALKKGEHRGKVYQFMLSDCEPSKYLCDFILSKGMTIAQAKKEILAEVKIKLGLDIPIDRCRLRKKSWRNAGVIYHDEQKFEDDIPIYTNWEIFLQVLDGPEVVTSVNQLTLFAKRWHPSELVTDPFVEVVLDNNTVEELSNKLSAVSGIPAENIEFAKGQGAFPCDMSVLNIHTDLDWSTSVATLDMWPLYIFDDGYVIYYRDKTEELKQLTDDERKGINNKENARLNKAGSTITTYSPRKEKALKIYLESAPSRKVIF